MTNPSSLWHPFTQHALAAPAIHIDRAEGAYLYTKDGGKILDGISSWWVNTHGHCHPKIVKVVQEQAARLEQVIFAGFTHEPAERLAEKLLRAAGPTFTHVFLSDSGSTAVEVAVKMAIGYWEHNGQPRRRIAALDQGYHGDTFGGMAMGGRSVFNALYAPYLFDVTHVPFPEKGLEHLTVDKFETLLIRDGANVAALVIEPLVLGAAGMKMYPPEILKSLRELCDKYGVLLIADEVMTGFGRTGTMFACEQAGITPDILCLSKGLTGGFLPLGATLCRKDIYDAFYQKDRSKMFFHSSSYAGNPLACAAAVASLEIWETEPVLERVRAIARAHEAALPRFSTRPEITDVRYKGAIFALDIKAEDEGYLSGLAPRLYDFFLSHDVLLRPIGNTVYIMPPYCITKEELERIYDVIGRALDTVRDEGQQRAA